MKKIRRLVLLDRYFETIQNRNYMNNLDNAFKREKKKNLKRSIILIGPLLLGLGSLVFDSVLLFILGAGITIGGIITIEVIDIFHEFKQFSKDYNSPNVSAKLFETLDPDQVLNNENTLKKGADFYSSMAKEQISRHESEDERKYREALNRQQLQLNQGCEILGLNETMYYVSEELHQYSLIYNLPPIEIEQTIWDSLFSSVFEVFFLKEDISDYYDYMTDLSRSVCVKSLLNNSDSISIQNFLDELFLGYGVNSDDIDLIQKSIKKGINSKSKVLNIADLMNK